MTDPSLTVEPFDSRKYADEKGFVEFRTTREGETTGGDYVVTASGNGYQSTSLRLTFKQAQTLLAKMSTELSISVGDMKTLYTDGEAWVDRKSFILLREDRARLVEENVKLDAKIQELQDLVDQKNEAIQELETAVDHLSQDAAGEDI